MCERERVLVLRVRDVRDVRGVRAVRVVACTREVLVCLVYVKLLTILSLRRCNGCFSVGFTNHLIKI